MLLERRRQIPAETTVNSSVLVDLLQSLPLLVETVRVFSQRNTLESLATSSVAHIATMLPHGFEFRHANTKA
jgi:hypothetical protein